MPTIIMSNSAAKDATAKDPSLHSRIGPFLHKLKTAHTARGLHIEPIQGSVDPHVRTARVDNFYRAVLFQLTQGDDAVYVYHGVWPHDDAIDEARNVTLKVNPRNGTSEVTRVAAAFQQSQASVEQARRQAQERLAQAQRQAQEIDRQAALLEETNARVSQQLAQAAAPSVARHGKPSSAFGRIEQAAAKPVTTPDAPPRWPAGLSVEVLRDELGLDVSLAAAALAAERESQLLDLALTAEVPWQAELLLSLATGSTVDDVREAFELRPPEDVEAVDEDEAILAGLRTRAARSVFTWAENDEDLRHAIESLSFQQWQLFLHPQQRALVERHTSGPTRISGGAGTGKTVVAIHRAKWLADQAAKSGEDASILLTTFTRNLADDLRHQITQLAPELPLADKLGESGIMVGGLDALATVVLQKAGDGIADVTEQVIGRRRTRILTHNPGNGRAIFEAVSDDLPEDLRSADFLASEYELVILPQKVTTLQHYLRVRRPGRGIALDRGKRAAVWNAIEAYRDQSSSQDVTSFAERLALAAAWLDAQAANGAARPFRHVVVDEAQDLSPSHLQLLRALVEPGPDDLFLAEDSHQRIYGKKITLSHYGIQVRGRSRRLTRNYRTTRQNLALAFGILDPGAYEDMEGQAEEHHYVSPRSGPEPRYIPAKNRASELDAATTLLREWIAEDKNKERAAPESIAILVRDRYQRDIVATGLAERGVDVRPVDRESAGRGRPLVMTMHRAKGLEFRKVLLFDVSKAAIPRALHDQQYSQADAADALLRERSLLYVAATRARDQLAISWSGEPSPLLEQLTSGK
ncbi:MAG: 3'-5' exonuclease [Actinomycetaceae bacterium]|nr:3'-5' exonuclease [Actinomycetaceae bacterium]